MKLLTLLTPSPSNDVADALAGFNRVVSKLDCAMDKANYRIDLIDSVTHRLENERMELIAAQQKALSVKARILAIVG